MYKGLLDVQNKLKGRKYENKETEGAGCSTTPRPRSRRASMVESLYEATVVAMEEDYKPRQTDINEFRQKMEQTNKSSKKVQMANMIFERNKISAVSFIRENFSRKECVHYVHHDTKFNATLPREKPCYCGGVEADHQTDEKTELLEKLLTSELDEKAVDENEKEKSERLWSESTSIQEMTTDAYGTIEFGENLLKAAKYVRLADNSTMESVKQYIVKYWNLTQQRPYLALSIVGGAKNFKLDGRNKEKFKAGMIAAAKATNAWVITSGTNAGVMKLVGEAVNEGQYLISEGDKMKRGLKAIGICPWGYVHGNSSLINKNLSEFNNVRYESNVEIKTKEPSPLNPHHTHFLLVDDGNRNRYGGAGLRNFRSEFEKMLMECEPGGLGIPVVTLLLEGGTDAIFEVKENLAKGKPCVVIGGSGRAADILAYAQRNASKNTETGLYSLREGHIRHVEKLLEESFMDKVTGKLTVSRKKKFMSWIMECINYNDLIIVFDIDNEDNLDKKILSALLIGDDLTVQSQMYLSMVWNRVDIAEEKVFKNRNVSFHDNDLYEVMAHSLMMDRLSFVELLVMNGFCMHAFLDVKRLRDLYNNAVIQHPHLLVQINKNVGPCSFIHLNTIHKLLIFFMKSHSNTLYEADVPSNTPKVMNENNSKLFDYPFFELFIWAVLCNKPNLRGYFWEKSGCPLVAALFASTFYGVLSEMYKLSDTEEVKNLRTEFLHKANSVMQIAYENDLSKALALAEKKTERFGNRSLIQLSFINNLKSFIGNQTCQRIVMGNWRRGFWKINHLAIIITIFCPLLISTSLFTFIPPTDTRGSHNFWDKLCVFYHAPIVKYTSNVITYILFLLLYTSVALFNFEWQIQEAEVVLYIWFLILILDELREVCSQPFPGVFKKLRGHLSNVWNKFDFIISFIGIVGFILKNFKQTFQVSRIFFAINCSLLYCRLFRVYHASWRLGPKLVVFHRMISEIVTFMLLLIIFILGYGTASQALINPTQEFNIEDLPQMISNIVYLPYWQMYGELSLESIEIKDKTVCYEEDFCEDFTMYNSVTVFFLAIYMLVGNVMLLNLLIAIFTAVFEEVQENSVEVWKFEMFRLVEEYDRKPVLPVPFTPFEEAYRLCKKVFECVCKSGKENVDFSMPRMIETLALLEQDSLNTFLNKKVEEESSFVDKKISNMEDKILTILENIGNSCKNTDGHNDWGDSFPAGVMPYSATSGDNMDLDREIAEECLTDKPEYHTSKGADRSGKTERYATNDISVDEQITERMKRMDGSITALENVSSKTLLKIEEIYSLMMSLKTKEI